MKKNIFILVFAIILGVGVCEFIFRFNGIIPGYKWVMPFEKTTSLILLNDWITDSNGIYKLNPTVNNKIISYNKSFNGLWESDTVDLVIKYLISSHQKIKPSPKFSVFFSDEAIVSGFAETMPSKFAHHVNQISNKDIFQDSVDFYYIQFLKYPINSDGFYSIPFRYFETKKKKILLIGDSFVFGFSAVPSYNNFACLLATKGYAVFNAGIPGTDPAQYCRIVEKYLMKIKPDVVIVCPYIGNDIMQNDRKLYPDSFVYFPTNVSWIKGYFNNHYFRTPKEAYTFFEKKSEILPNNQSVFASLIKRSALFTKIYLSFNEDKSANAMQEGQSFYKDSLSFSEYYFEHIDSICNTNKIKCNFIAIPDRSDIEMQVLNKPPFVFKKVNYISIQNLKNDDYMSGEDNHFNNSGHMKTADFIDSLLKNNGTFP